MSDIFQDHMCFEIDLFDGETFKHYVKLTVLYSSEPSIKKDEQYYIETDDCNERFGVEIFKRYPNAEYQKSIDKIVETHKAYRQSVKAAKLLNR